MFIGNVMLLVMNLPLAPALRLAPAHPLRLSRAGHPAALAGRRLCQTLSFFTVVVAIAFGVVGWLMIKLDFPRAPLVLALVLAPMMETSLRQSLMLSLGSPLIFVERPISAVC